MNSNQLFILFRDTYVSLKDKVSDNERNLFWSNLYKMVEYSIDIKPWASEKLLSKMKEYNAPILCDEDCNILNYIYTEEPSMDIEESFTKFKLYVSKVMKLNSWYFSQAVKQFKLERSYEKIQAPSEDMLNPILFYYFKHLNRVF